MTDIEKKATKAACEYAGLKCPPTEDTGVLTTTDYLTFKDGYIKACEEYESLPKVRGWWVARDENGDLWAYEMKPRRLECTWWDRDYSRLSLNEGDYPEITWESEPVEVELLIRRV